MRAHTNTHTHPANLLQGVWGKFRAELEGGGEKKDCSIHTTHVFVFHKVVIITVKIHLQHTQIPVNDIYFQVSMYSREGEAYGLQLPSVPFTMANSEE